VSTVNPELVAEAGGPSTAYLPEGFIEDAWYVAAWSHEIGPDALFARTLLGRPLVFYRRRDGGVVAMDDRCCHRAAPLSIGRKEGDGVRCLYHGLKFDATGACVEMPGQERIPPMACVRTYPVVEQDRFVWVWMGAKANANPADILRFFWHDSPEWAMKPGYIHYQAHVQLIVDNLLDFAHLSYVHPTTLGTARNAQVKAQVQAIEGGLRITRWALDDEMPPNHRRVARFEGRVDRWQIYEWHPPAFMRMDAGSAPTGTGAPEGRIAPEAMKFRHTSVQTPETTRTSHYFFGQARNFELQDEAMTEAIFQDVSTAFAEDRHMIEAQQKILDATPGFKPVATVHDQALNMARHLVRKRLVEQAQAQAQSQTLAVQPGGAT
jgi:phenylpropionate dioxygenase-like ring-hydroxylating dioxygenase large terminal subunit